LSPLSQKSEGKHCAKNAAEGRKKKMRKNKRKTAERIKEPSMRGTGFRTFPRWAGLRVGEGFGLPTPPHHLAIEPPNHPQSHKRAGTIKQNKPKTDLFLSQLHLQYRVEKGERQ